MPISLPSTYSPLGLRSTYATEDENAATAAAMQQDALDGQTSIGAGLSRGLYQVPAMLANAGAQVVEPLSTQYSRPVFDWASQQNQAAQRIQMPNAPQSWDQIHNFGDAASYAGAAIGENLPNMMATIPAAVLARLGLRGAALSPFTKNLAATSAAAFPLQMGEMAGSMREDPTLMANTTPGQRLATAAGYGALTAPMEAVDEALLMGRATGAGKAVKNVFKDGVKATAKDALGHVAKAVPEAALTEGLPEVAQTATQQAMLGELNPKRDTSRDANELQDSFFKGWAAGSGPSAVGRGADVAWAQGRGATEAIRGLLKDKVLPASLKDSGDSEIVAWDKEDDAQRNSWAKDVADSIMGSDAAQSIKDAANDFYEKASQGASDAWKSVSEAVGAESKLHRARSSVDRFINSAKKANSAVTGKADAEADAVDQHLYDSFSEHLDPRGAVARDTELKSKLFNTVKDSLLDDSWHELPWHELEDEFGTIGRATEAVVKLRENLVRAGKLEHDAEFGSLLDATTKEGSAGEKAMMDTIHRYGAEYITRQPEDGELREMARGIRDLIAKYPSMSAQHKEAFDAQMGKAFGANKEKVMQALAPKHKADLHVDTSEDSGISEEAVTAPTFIGSATKSARKAIADGTQENTIESHGGFWKLGSGNDTSTDRTITKRFDDLQADLRNDGHYVKALTPLEYAELSGIAPGKIAGHLGTSVANLKDHPARMLHVEKRDLGKDKLTLDKDDLTSLAGKTSKSLSSLDESVEIKEPERVAAIKAALGLNKKGEGGKQRKAMKELGLEHGVELRTLEDGRTFLRNNKLHGGNGVFTVHMADGSKHNISAQALIETMRTRGNGEVSSRSAYRMFTSGIAALRTIDGVEKITVDDIWGRTDENPFAGVTGRNSSYFKLIGDQTLGAAHKASSRGNLKTEVMVLEKKVEKLNEQIAKLSADLKTAAAGKRHAIKADRSKLKNDLAELKLDLAEAKAQAEAFQKEIEGEGDRPGTVTTTGKADGVHDFNDDGTPVQPYGKDPERSTDRTPLTFNGHTLRLRPGVRAKDLTGDAKKILAAIKDVRNLIGNDQLTAKLDMALDLIGRSAAANKDSNAKARDALLGMAATAVRDALREEMFAAHEAAIQLPADQRGEYRAKYAAIRKISETPELDILTAKYLTAQEKADQFIGTYMTYRAPRQKKDIASATERQGNRWSHHDVFLASLETKTDEQITADGVARQKRIERYAQFSGDEMVELVALMKSEQAVARQELRDRKAGTTHRKVAAEPTRVTVGVTKVPTAAARRAAVEISDRQKLLRENLAEQGKLRGSTPTRVNKKNLADLKAHEELLRSEIRELIPMSNETQESSVTTTNGKKEQTAPKVEEPKAEEPKAEEPKAEEPKVEEPTTERTKQAETHEQAFEQALADVEKLATNLKGVSTALRAAFGELKQAFIEGELNDKALVANLRAALASFRAAAGDATRIVAQAVQRFIKAYHAVEPSAVEELVSEKANAEGSFASGSDVTAEQMAEVEAYITKTLGPDVVTSLEKDLGGNSAAWNRKGGKAYIRIAINALNPTSKAHHEAMHEFFQRLSENNPEAADVLRKAANGQPVIRQVERFFNQDANYAKIKAALDSDEHERVAYMFQLWAAGKLSVGPQTKTWFGKVTAALRKVFGIISDSTQAEAIMEHFHNGEMSNQNDVARVLAKDPAEVAKLLKRANEYSSPLTEKAKELFYTSQNMLIESGNKGFEKIGRIFSTETGRTNEEISFFDAKTMKTNQYNDHLWNILRKQEKGDLDAALKALQEGAVSNDPKIKAIQGSLHKLLDHLHAYMTEQGVKIGKLENYFPRSWDSLAIADKKAEFVAMLQADHLKATGEPMSAEVAEGIASNIIENRGAEPLSETELNNGYTPFMAASNKRVLDFISNPEFSKFQENNIESILTTYIAQAVHKAEYTKRFGENGKKLRDMIQGAVGEEIGTQWTVARTAAEQKLKELNQSLRAQKKTPDEIVNELNDKGYAKGAVQPKHVADELTDADAKAKFDAFEPKLRQMVRSIMAMEGTLGADINPSLRKVQSALIVYTNLRTLSMSLFSQVIDPLGVIIRGGTGKQAWETFKHGVEGVVAGWKGKAIDSKEYAWARQLGIVDAGAYLNSQGNAYTSVFLGKTAKKINDRLFRWNGVEGASQGTRVGAMLAAMDFIKTHSTLPEPHSERWLAELNLKPSDITVVGDELDLTNPKIQQAIFRWVESAILRPNASMRPSWASDPHFALVFHMKQFTYAMQKVILERVVNEAEHGNLEPAAAMLLTYVPAMMAADFLRGLLANGGKEPPWKRKWTAEDYLWNGVQRAGLLGVPQFGLDAVQWGPAELLGPMAGQVAHAGKTFSRDIERDIDLDIKASTTGAIKDIERAASYNGVTAAAKKTLRDAMPINSLTKHYVYDELIGK